MAIRHRGNRIPRQGRRRKSPVLVSDIDGALRSGGPDSAFKYGEQGPLIGPRAEEAAPIARSGPAGPENETFTIHAARIYIVLMWKFRYKGIKYSFTSVLHAIYQNKSKVYITPDGQGSIYMQLFITHTYIINITYYYFIIYYIITNRDFASSN